MRVDEEPELMKENAEHSPERVERRSAICRVMTSHELPTWLTGSIQASQCSKTKCYDDLILIASSSRDEETLDAALLETICSKHISTDLFLYPGCDCTFCTPVRTEKVKI